MWRPMPGEAHEGPGAEKVDDLEDGITFRLLGLVDNMPELQDPRSSLLLRSREDLMQWAANVIMDS